MQIKDSVTRVVWRFFYDKKTSKLDQKAKIQSAERFIHIGFSGKQIAAKSDLPENNQREGCNPVQKAAIAKFLKRKPFFHRGRQKSMDT